MKFLQIKNTPDGKLRVLKMGVDFDGVLNNFLIKNIRVKRNIRLTNPILISDNEEYRYSIDYEIISKISDCYQLRPLIELGGWCEFNIIKFNRKVGFNQIIEKLYELEDVGSLEFFIE